MSDSWRHFLTGLALWLAAGTGVGWLYGRPVVGFTVACAAALVWHVRHLLKFEQGLRTWNFDYFRSGEGIWSQVYSQVNYLRQRNRRQKRKYRQLLQAVRELTNALPDGGIVLNSANEILQCNVAAQELAGFDARQDRGQRVDNILRDPRFIEYLKSGDFAAGTEIPSPVRPGGWLFCMLVPYGANQRLLLIRDVTERRRLTTMRREFIANASHELRSPLTVISGYLDTLADDPEAPEHWHKPLHRMRDEAVRMNRILEELLRLSRLEAAAAPPGDERIDVALLLERTAAIHAGAPGVPAIDIGIETDLELRGSVVEMESVAQNLLSNAVRHTPADGRVRMIWRARADGAELAVEDSGEGIAEEHIPRVTERFFRVDHGRSREEGGVGLGLAIVKHVLARHDAELIISSKLGEGSSFVCRFPRERLLENGGAAEPARLQR